MQKQKVVEVAKEIIESAMRKNGIEIKQIILFGSREMKN